MALSFETLGPNDQLTALLASMGITVGKKKIIKNKGGNMKKNIIFGIDGDQHTAYFDDFINLQESICGFGDTQKDSVVHLLTQWFN